MNDFSLSSPTYCYGDDRVLCSVLTDSSMFVSSICYSCKCLMTDFSVITSTVCCGDDRVLCPVLTESAIFVASICYVRCIIKLHQGRPWSFYAAWEEAEQEAEDEVLRQSLQRVVKRGSDGEE